MPCMQSHQRGERSIPLPSTLRDLMLDMRPICGVMAMKALLRMSRISSLTSRVMSCTVAQYGVTYFVSQNKCLNTAPDPMRHGPCS